MVEVKKAKAGKPGWPSIQGKPMTPAERVREYWLRQRSKREQASDKPESASDRFLAECLAAAFKTPHPDFDVQQFLIEKYLQELCNRHKITAV